MPEATANSRRNLWFHTGDRGSMDEDGYISFVDRKKDAIRRRGETPQYLERYVRGPRSPHHYLERILEDADVHP